MPEPRYRLVPVEPTEEMIGSFNPQGSATWCWDWFMRRAPDATQDDALVEAVTEPFVLAIWGNRGLVPDGRMDELRTAARAVLALWGGR